MSNVSTTTAAIYQAVLDSLNSSGECGVLPPAPPGKSAYEVAVDNGFVGSEKQWLDTLTFEQEQEIARLEARILANENYLKDSKNAASRLVGTSQGNVMEVTAFGLGDKSIFSRPNESSVEQNEFRRFEPSITGLTAPTIGVSISWASSGAGRRVLAISGEQESNTFYTHKWTTAKVATTNTIYTTGNTKKDSNTNLLLESGDSIPNESAASRLVGTEPGNVLPGGTGGLGRINFSDVKNLMDEQKYITSMQSQPHLQRLFIQNSGAWGYPSGVHFRVSPQASFGLFYTHYGIGSGNASVRLVTKFGETSKSGLILAQGINAFPDSNGFWKTSSPVVRVYANEIDPNDDAEKQGVTFTRNGVGNYTLHNTLGLAQEGWRLELPQDDNRNPLVAIETEELENGDLNIRTYRRIFSMETFTFTCDYDNPLDIPDGRCVDVRLHEILPEEPEPVEEPIVDEETESEVVEEPVVNEPEVSEEEPKIVPEVEDPAVVEEDVPVEGDPKD